jgi:hypothetical protein
MTNRRSFLGSPVTLPLIGGGLTLIGRPTAVVEPVTSELLEGYHNWLDHGLCSLVAERMYAGEMDEPSPYASNAAAFRFHYPGRGRFRGEWDPPSNRAALVLSMVGCKCRAS